MQACQVQIFSELFLVFFFKVTPSIICIVDQMGMDILSVICCGQVGDLKSWKVLTVADDN